LEVEEVVDPPRPASVTGKLNMAIVVMFYEQGQIPGRQKPELFGKRLWYA
jgi:hypothetical protein